MQLRGLGKWSLLVEAIREDCLQEVAPMPSRPAALGTWAGGLDSWVAHLHLEGTTPSRLGQNGQVRAWL